MRQAIIWDASGKQTICAFTSAGSRDATLRELRDAAKGLAAVRLFFFSESSATTPDGRKVDIIVVEVGDLPTDFYGQRLFAAEKPPQRVAEDESSLGSSALAGVLGQSA